MSPFVWTALGTHEVSRGFQKPKGPPPTCSRVASPTLSAKMASVLSRPVADLSLAALESRSA